MTPGETLADYVGAFVNELAGCGVNHVVICPGSRSTPLAMMMAKHPDLRVWMHVDERSAAYFALGMAKAHRAPVAVLCSSGTAAANFFPAVVEARESRVPLVVLTADRPHELRDVGAPQAIDQLKMYGDYPKWFAEMALPEATSDMLAYARTAAARAAAVSLDAPAGPVHLNFPFREPLVPELRRAAPPPDNDNHKSVDPGKRMPDAAVMDKLAAELANVARGLIVCGPQDDPGFPEAVVELARSLQYPILADPLSQLRSGSHEQTWVIDGYDAFLRDEQVAEAYGPEVVLRFGAMPVSKAFTLYLKKHPDCRQIIVDDGGWREPTLFASDMIQADPAECCRMLSRKVRRETGSWGEAWRRMNLMTQEQVAAHEWTEPLSEGRVFAELQKVLPEGAVLFAGNSMPIRDMDTFFMNNERGIRTMANRGANGIDGVVSAALGASTTGAPLVLVIGDLSFYHDLNGLLAAKRHMLNVTIVLIHNNGGGIFSFLPQANEAERFEELFGTPTDLDFAKTVEMYGGSFISARDWQHFRKEVSRSMASGGLNVIEVRTDRAENTELHREIWDRVSREVRTLLNDVRRGRFQ